MFSGDKKGCEIFHNIIKNSDSKCILPDVFFDNYFKFNLIRNTRMKDK